MIYITPALSDKHLRAYFKTMINRGLISEYDSQDNLKKEAQLLYVACLEKTNDLNYSAQFIFKNESHFAEDNYLSPLSLEAWQEFLDKIEMKAPVQPVKKTKTHEEFFNIPPEPKVSIQKQSQAANQLQANQSKTWDQLMGEINSEEADNLWQQILKQLHADPYEVQQSRKFKTLEEAQNFAHNFIEYKISSLGSYYVLSEVFKIKGRVNYLESQWIKLLQAKRDQLIEQSARDPHLVALDKLLDQDRKTMEQMEEDSAQLVESIASKWKRFRKLKKMKFRLHEPEHNEKVGKEWQKFLQEDQQKQLNNSDDFQQHQRTKQTKNRDFHKQLPQDELGDRLKRIKNKQDEDDKETIKTIQSTEELKKKVEQLEQDWQAFIKTQVALTKNMKVKNVKNMAKEWKEFQKNKKNKHREHVNNKSVEELGRELKEFLKQQRDQGVSETNNELNENVDKYKKLLKEAFNLPDEDRLAQLGLGPVRVSFTEERLEKLAQKYENLEELKKHKWQLDPETGIPYKEASVKINFNDLMKDDSDSDEEELLENLDELEDQELVSDKRSGMKVSKKKSRKYEDMDDDDDFEILGE